MSRKQIRRAARRDASNCQGPRTQCGVFVHRVGSALRYEGGVSAHEQEQQELQKHIAVAEEYSRQTTRLFGFIWLHGMLRQVSSY